MTFFLPAFSALPLLPRDLVSLETALLPAALLVSRRKRVLWPGQAASYFNRHKCRQAKLRTFLFARICHDNKSSQELRRRCCFGILYLYICIYIYVYFNLPASYTVCLHSMFCVTLVCSLLADMHPKELLFSTMCSYRHAAAIPHTRFLQDTDGYSRY